jgi:hypothetical protein
MRSEHLTGDEWAGEPLTSRWSRGYLIAGLALATAYFALPVDTAKLVIWPIVGFACVIAIVVGVRLNHPSARSAWYLLAGGAACLSIGDGLSSFRTFVQHNEAPFPYIDIAYLAMYSLVIGGLVILVRRRSTGHDRSIVIDAAIITAGLGLVWWVLLLAPYFRGGDINLLDRLTSIVYPVGDFVILSAGVRLWVGRGRRPVAFWLLIAGLCALLIADGLFGYLSLSGKFSEHTVIDLGWIVFYTAFGAAALHRSNPRHRQRRRGGSGGAFRPRRARPGLRCDADRSHRRVSRRPRCRSYRRARTWRRGVEERGQVPGPRRQVVGRHRGDRR